MKEKINVCLFITVYSFFLYLLMNGYQEKDIFIFADIFPKEISKNVKHFQLPEVSFVDGPKMAPLDSARGIIKNIQGYCRYFYGYIKLRAFLFIKTFNKEVTVYGHAQSPFSFIFYENENSNLIEDGIANYCTEITETHKINPLLDIFLHICGIYFLKNTEAFGSHKNIKNIYLTYNVDHPLIKNKVRIINPTELWNNLSTCQKRKILTIFNIENQIFDFNGETILILTQPLSQEGQMTLNDELNIYNEVMKKFNKYQVIIKPHPRDDKDYKKIYPQVTIIEKTFPIEILSLIGVNPTVVSSIVSASVLTFKDSEIYIYDGDLKNERLNKIRDDLLNLIKNN